MRFVGVMFALLGSVVIWSALQGRSPVDEWNAVKGTLTHAHAAGGGG